MQLIEFSYLYRYLLGIILLISTQAHADLSSAYKEQKASANAVKHGAEEQYLLVKDLRSIISQAISGRFAKTNLTVGSAWSEALDPYDYFFTEEFIVRFGSQGTAPSKFMGKQLNCGLKRSDQFESTYPFIIGIKRGEKFVQTAEFEYGNAEFEIKSSGECYIRRSISLEKPVERCLVDFSADNGLAVHLIKNEFNRGLADCAKTFNYPKFNNLRLK